MSFNPLMHNPDLNYKWVPLVANRNYVCSECSHQIVRQTNHTGSISNECQGRCRDILHPHTEREIVLRKYTRHDYVSEVELP